MVNPSQKDVSCVKGFIGNSPLQRLSILIGGTFPLLVSYAGQTGGQLISIIATGTDRASFESRITFNIPSKQHLDYCKSLCWMCVDDKLHFLAATGTQPPTQMPLNLNCSAELLQESEQVRVSCTGNRDFATLMFECSQNGQSITEGCELYQIIYRELAITIIVYSL